MTMENEKMKTKQLKNKDGQPLTTKEGKVLFENTLEKGDSFIPQINSVIENKHEAIVKGEKKIITSYTIPAKVKQQDGQVVEEPDTKNGAVFLKLTPTQAKKLKQLSEEIELNQTIFYAYEYTHEEHGVCIGITHKPFKEPISF
jgi:hypothetical protein